MIGAIETAVAVNFAPPPRFGAAAAEESTPNSTNGFARAALELGATLQAGATSLVDGQNLTDEERRTIRRRSARDQEVRHHEGAHARAGGQYADAPHYNYERGPNGKAYAVAGQVSIDVSPVPGDPQGTIDKMAVVKWAALAPAKPSALDRRIASRAEAEGLMAQAELRKERAAESSGEDEPSLTSRVDQPSLSACVVGESSPNSAFTGTRAGVSTLFDVVA
jgi:hypothetical protein